MDDNDKTMKLGAGQVYLYSIETVHPLMEPCPFIVQIVGGRRRILFVVFGNFNEGIHQTSSRLPFAVLDIVASSVSRAFK